MKHCCERMTEQVLHQCTVHSDLSDCPDALVGYFDSEYGIRVLDGGTSFVVIRHCPWCGAQLAKGPGTPVRPTDPYWKLRPSAPTPPDEICHCPTDTPLVLQGGHFENPLACARCNLDVSPEAVGANVELIDAVASWRDFHNCFYFLWLDSGEFETWASAILRDPSSRVTTEGRRLARALSARRPCYLWWFQDEAAEDRLLPTHCPCCSKNLKERFSGERPQGGSLRVCEDCLVALAV
jgi:hypothetical protein